MSAMPVVRLLILALVAVALAACSRMPNPLPMTGERAAYVGTWVSKQSIPAEGKTDNAVLILGEDSSGSYTHCTDYNVQRNDGSVSKGSTYLHKEGKVTALSDQQLTLSLTFSNWGGFAMNFDVEIGGRPYMEDGAWHLMVDGTSLRKLGPDESSDHEQWPCWSSDKPADDSPSPGRRT